MVAKFFPATLAAVLAGCAALVLPGQAQAAQSDANAVEADAPALLQCVPYARETSGIALRGDAWTWWEQARDRYARGHLPRPGAVLAIEPFAGSRLGHVATVRRIVDTRTILVDHANWSKPGGIEKGAVVLDVSPANDWSEVRVWFAPSRNLGTTHWPVAGFIYNQPARGRFGGKIAGNGESFSDHRADLPKPVAPATLAVRTAASHKAAPAAPAGARVATIRVAGTGGAGARALATRDPIGAILAGAY